MRYEFTLVIEGDVELNDDLFDSLYEAGCGDATFARRGGKLYGHFEREGGSIGACIKDAAAQVHQAGRGLKVIAVEWPNQWGGDCGDFWISPEIIEKALQDGRAGNPFAVADHPGFNARPIRSYEEVVDSLLNGYPISITHHEDDQVLREEQ